MSEQTRVAVPAGPAGPPGRSRPGAGQILPALLASCHPEPTAAVTLLSVALAAATGRSAGGVVAVGAAVLTGQLSVGWSNDYVDRDRDRRTGRTDKPVVAGRVPARLVGGGALAAAAACVPLSLLSGWRGGTAHLVAVAFAWAYNLRLKATPLSWLPYLVSFALLPAFIVLGLPGHPAPPWWLVTAGGLLGAGAHFANVLPDLDDDLATGVRGLPHRIGAGASRAAAAVLLLAASAVLVLGPGRPGPVALAGLALAVALVLGGVAAGRRAGSRWAFRITMAVAALDVALLVARGHAVAPASGPVATYRGLLPAQALPRPSFVLRDTDGARYDFAARTRGVPTLLYFGYTHCPDECPTTMADLAAALAQVPPGVRDRVRVVFVTTDPRRDTPAVLRRWLDRFDRGLPVPYVGLVGSDAEVAAAEGVAGVPVAAPEPVPGGGYAVTHAAEVLAYAVDDKAHALYLSGTTVGDYAADLPQLLKERQPGD